MNNIIKSSGQIFNLISMALATLMVVRVVLMLVIVVMLVIVLPPHQASSSPLSCPQLHRYHPPPHYPSSLVQHIRQNHLQQWKTNGNPNTINDDDDCAPCLSSTKTSSPWKSPLIIARAPCNSFNSGLEAFWVFLNLRNLTNVERFP